VTASLALTDLEPTMTPREFKNNARTHVVNKGYAAVEHAFGPTACVDAYVDQEQEERDFHVATEGEWDQAGAHQIGCLYPDRAWINSDRDVWYANPYYKGPAQPHPEDDHAWEAIEAGHGYDPQEVIAIAQAERDAWEDFNRNMPF
jgi:hypothetical protein